MATSEAEARVYAHEYQEVFAAVRRAAQEAGMTEVSADPATGEIIARSGASFSSWGEKVAIYVGQAQPGSTQVRIQSDLKFGLVDWGKNAKNLNKLFFAIDRVLSGSSLPGVVAAPVAAPAPPAGWHPDPMGRHEHRWWDGAAWTDQVADAGVQAVDPPG